MTVAAVSQSNDAANRDSSPLLNWLVLGGLVAVFIAVLWFVWWFIFGSMPSQHTVEVDPRLVQQASMRAVGQAVAARARQPDPRGVRKLDDAQWLVNSTDGTISIRKTKTDYTLRPNYHLRVLLAPEQLTCVVAYRRLIMDDAMARQVGLTKDQVKSLRSIRPIGMELADADSQKLKTLWSSYVGAAGDARKQAEKSLLESFDELAKTHLQASKLAAAQRVDEIQKIITPEVLAKLNKQTTTPPGR